MKEILVNAIENGTVIDHIPSDNIHMIVQMLKITHETTTIGFNLSSKRMGSKAILKISNRFLSEEEANKIALLAPHASVNIIKDFNVIEKKNMQMPSCVEGIINCTNPNCITNKNPLKTRFHILKKNPLVVRCHYCERTMSEKEIMF